MEYLQYIADVNFGLQLFLGVLNLIINGIPSIHNIKKRSGVYDY